MPHHLVHIGLYKTGTSWLQKIAATAQNELPFTYAHKHFANWVRTGHVPGADQEARLAELKTLFEATRGEDTFISCEGLVSEDHEKLAACICEVLPDAHILVTTRAPQDYIVSAFNSSTKRGHALTAQEFAEERTSSQLMHIFNFDGILKAFRKHTSDDHIHFLPYEYLRDEPGAFLSRISDLLHQDLSPYLLETAQNVSPPPRLLAFMREINRLVEKEAPEFARSEAMNVLRTVTIMGMAHAEEMHKPMHSFVSRIEFDDSMPKLRGKVLRQIVEMNQCLKEMPIYEKYLDEYNFWLEEKGVKGKHA